MNRPEYRVPLPAPVRRVRLMSGQELPKALPSAPAPRPEDVWQTEIGKQLHADRQLIEGLRDRLMAAARELQEQHRQRVHDWRQAAVELALAVAAKLLHREVLAGEFAVEEVVRDMVGQLGEGDLPLTIRLHPEDLALLQRRLGGKPLLPERPGVPRLAADDALHRGDCRIESREELLLCDLAGQLAELREHLLRSL